MRIAVFSDVHGNLPALKATLAAIDAEHPDAIWYAGDFVGYGPWPDECVRLIQARADVAISGNYDVKVLKYPRKAVKWEHSKDARKLAAFRHAYENLAPESLAYLESLPSWQRIPFGEQRVLMIHSAPDSDREGITPDTPAARLEAIAATASAEVILTGHTHRPLVTRACGTLFVNPGSAGRPVDGDTRASFALVTLDESGAQAEIRRVTYPVEAVIAALAQTDLPPDFAVLYERARPTF